MHLLGGSLVHTSVLFTKTFHPNDQAETLACFEFLTKFQ